MFCPNCKSEFRDGFTHCKKCNTDLVDKLESLPEETPEKKPVEYEYAEMITIAETWDLYNIALARGVLECANIRFTITNEFTQNLVAASGFGNPITASKIMVEKGKEEEARLILEDIFTNMASKNQNADD
ncbi:MAG: DUF2007 domain-containing protein [Fibrobacter sp.]|nr:DUF2007 domain-containing protein [Fibrobacter sp.]